LQERTTLPTKNKENYRIIRNNTFLVLTASSANFTNAMPSAVTCCVVEGEKPYYKKKIQEQKEKNARPQF